MKEFLRILGVLIFLIIVFLSGIFTSEQFIISKKKLMIPILFSVKTNYPSGALKSKTDKNHIEFIDLYKEYYENGKMRYSYKGLGYLAEITKFYENGNPMMTKKLYDGQLIDLYAEFNADGKIIYSEDYDSFNKSGDERGNLFSRIFASSTYKIDIDTDSTFTNKDYVDFEKNYVLSSHGKKLIEKRFKMGRLIYSAEHDFDGKLISETKNSLRPFEKL